jgi:hypothetical protein
MLILLESEKTETVLKIPDACLRLVEAVRLLKAHGQNPNRMNFEADG